MQINMRLQYTTVQDSEQLCANVCGMPERMDRRLTVCILINPRLL